METASNTQKRRTFITEQLEKRQEVSFADIRAGFEGAERASIHGDVAALKKLGMSVGIVGPKKERRIISTNPRKITKKAFRSDQQSKEKEKIASVVATLIFGNPNIVRCASIADKDEMPEKEIEYNVTTKAIIEYLDKWGHDRAHGHYYEVKERLHQYWGCHDKTIAIDSGTTTDKIADKIRHFDLVKELDGLNNLTLFTNSRSIFSKTGAPECNIKTIVIGGRQRHQTESICGELARRCLASWDVAFGMTIVGATGIDTSTLMMGSYNDEEAAMKQELLSRAKIRVVVADVTKFAQHSFQIISKFAKIHPTSIDLLVIDTHPREEDIHHLMVQARGEELGLDVNTWRSWLPVPILVADDLIELSRKIAARR